MPSVKPVHRSRFASAVFDVLNPIPYGFFVAALIFDITYATSRNVFWGKGAAWLITTGLLFAIIPRLINLVQVWIPPRGSAGSGARLDFWLNALGIVAAIFNAFVHSRDAYAMVPQNVILSVVTVALLGIGHFVVALHAFGSKEAVRE